MKVEDVKAGEVGLTGGPEVAILNVGHGDTKLTFDKSNPAERIRAARIVKDMIRRGYALLIETDDGAGNKVFTRALDFDENVCEYTIADFDPVQAAEADAEDTDAETKTTPVAKKSATRTKKVAADEARAVAVGRIAGG